MSRTVAIVSGGMDSVTLAHLIVRETDPELYLLSFDYGQRHAKELRCARECAERLHAEHEVADLSGLAPLLDSALTDRNAEVPEGHYASPTMAATVVPNRNMIMLSVAVGWAVSIGADAVATGVHAGDHPVYPDCRPEFIDSLQKTARLGTGNPDFQVVAPFVHKSKSQIAALGALMGVPFEKTWSCYKGGEIHCGRCSTCGERRAALVEAGVEDPTEYEVDAQTTWEIMEETPSEGGNDG